MLVCRRWTGRWPRHWFLLVFIDHVPSLLGRLCPLTEILAWDGGGWNRRRAPHLIFHIEDSMDFLLYLQSSRKDYLRISIRPLLLQHGVRLSDDEQKILERYDWRTDITISLIFCQNVRLSSSHLEKTNSLLK